MKQGKGKDAVSPVIGVVLMVAVTVILAAVVAAFVFGMVSGIQKSKNVVVTARSSGNDIILTYHGGPDHNSVAYLNLTVSTSEGSDTRVYWPVSIGRTYTSYQNSTPGQDHVVASVQFTDFSQQVILDTFV